MTATNTEKVKGCHWLPCSIANDCSAPIDAFFHPISLDAAVHQPQTEKRVELKDEEWREAVSFRGRELVSYSQCKLPNEISGFVMTLGQKSSPHDSPRINIGEIFDKVTEWDHNHKLDENNLTNDAIDLSSVSRSIDTLRILRSVSNKSVIFSEKMNFCPYTKTSK